MFWQNLSIRVKISVSIGALLLLLAAVCLESISGIRNLL